MATGSASELLRRHWPILALLLGATVLRGLAWYAVHPAWWIIGDTIGYLNVALHHVPERWRPGGYALMMLLPLLPFHHVALVTVVQHLMGLAGGVLVYATLLRLGIPHWAAALASVPALFDGYIVASEQMLASEALFGFLVIAGLAVLLWRADRPGYVEVVAAGLLLGLSTLTRIVGLPLIAVAVLILLLQRAGWLRLVALTAAFALPLLLYSAWFDRHYGVFNLTASSGVFLYGRTVNFVDCGKVRFTDESLRRLCPTEPVWKRNEIWYVFDPESPVAKTGLSVAGSNDLAGRFAAEAIRAQPGDYAMLALAGVVATFEWDQGVTYNDMLFDQDHTLPEDGLVAGLAYQRGADPRPITDPPLAHALRAYEGVVSVPGTVCLLALLLALAALALGRDPNRRGLRPALLLTAGVAAVLLLVPALTAIAAPRYRVPAIPALCLVVVISASLIASRIRGRRQDPVLD